MILPRAALAAVMAGCLSTASSAQVINEIRIDSVDQDIEYVELFGLPATDLSPFTYIVIGDAGANGGVIEEVISLNGRTIPLDGFFLIAEASFDKEAFGDVVDLTKGVNFEDADNVTHLLVSGFTGEFGDDLDTDDDGILDVMPFTIVDSIAIVKSLMGDPFYGSTTIGPIGNAAPGHVYRCPDGGSLTSGLGTLNIGGLMVGANDTPGGPNFPVTEASSGLATCTGAISVFKGGSQLLTLDASGTNVAFYFLLASASGSSPGLPIGGGLTLPLNQDGLVTFSLNNPNSAFLQNTFGQVDANMQAKSRIVLPPLPMNPGLVGAQISTAFIGFGPSFGLLFTSNPTLLSLI